MAENMEYAGFIAVSGTAETVRELQPAPEMLAEQAYPPSDKIGQSRAQLRARDYKSQVALTRCDFPLLEKNIGIRGFFSVKGPPNPALKRFSGPHRRTDYSRSARSPDRIRSHRWEVRCRVP